MNAQSIGSTTVADALCRAVRNAGKYASGDQSAPCAVLWPDGERLWEGMIPDLKGMLPELFVLGDYDPSQRIGPAIWLCCVEARAVQPSLPADVIPVFYLPGFSRQQLREMEECPDEMQILAEMQFRGAVWSHPNGKDWTPSAFLSSPLGGLGCDVARDAATGEALLRSFSRLLLENVTELQGHRLDSAFFNGLLAPDTPRAILRWMNDPGKEKGERKDSEWSAFCEQCARDYAFHPEKDGELHAGGLLGTRIGAWAEVWTRFADAPRHYPGVIALLEQADPSARSELAFHPDSWPKENDRAEKDLSAALRDLANMRPDESAARIHELEKTHAHRRTWVWKEIDRAPLACAMEHLEVMAGLSIKPLSAANGGDFGSLYAETGWKMDAAAVAALSCCAGLAQEEPLSTAVRSLYLHWVDESARNLQRLRKVSPASFLPRLPQMEAASGRLIVFVDGLRYDVASLLAKSLRGLGLFVDQSWDWSPFPTVTPTGKPFVSPIRGLFAGRDPGDEFAVVIIETGHILSADRFRGLLERNGLQLLQGAGSGDPNGSAWIELGGIDSRGHSDGWKIARTIRQETEDIAGRISDLLSRGWSEAVVVTDHGWLLLPGGLPKVELPRLITEHRWGRCAAMRESVVTDLPLIPWHWNRDTTVATPPGVGCFRANSEYSHGGISAQEMVVPRLVIHPAAEAADPSKLTEIKWVGFRCRVRVEGSMAGFKLDLRLRAADAASSRVEGKVPRDIAPDGTVSLPVSDPDDRGAAAVIVLLAPDGRVLHFLPTVIGGTSMGGKT